MKWLPWTAKKVVEVESECARPKNYIFASFLLLLDWFVCFFVSLILVLLLFVIFFIHANLQQMVYTLDGYMSPILWLPNSPSQVILGLQVEPAWCFNFVQGKYDSSTCKVKPKLKKQNIMQQVIEESWHV